MMKSILLAEDDPFLIDIYKEKLIKSKFAVSVERNGADVLKAIKEKKPDLLLLDIVLPKMTGWEILQNIAEGKEKFGDLKIIVLSNLGQKEEIEKGLRLGAQKYLIKAHYTPSQIIREIKKILK